MTFSATYDFRHVPHHLVEAYEKIGWIWIRFSLGHHGCHSALMRWMGDGEPREPSIEEAAA